MSGTGYKEVVDPAVPNGKKKFENGKKRHPAADLLRNSIQISRSERRVGTVPEMKIGLLAGEIRDLRSMRVELAKGFGNTKDDKLRLSFAKIILENHTETRKVIEAIPEFEIDPKPKKHLGGKSKDGQPVAQPGRVIDVE